MDLFGLPEVYSVEIKTAKRSIAPYKVEFSMVLFHLCVCVMQSIWIPLDSALLRIAKTETDTHKPLAVR